MYSILADYVSHMKKRTNKGVDKAFTQYLPCDWCLLSSKNIPRDNNKVKFTWSGLVIVIELIKSNVYKTRLLNGVIQKVHGSPFNFYKPHALVLDDSLKKDFINNLGELEVHKVLQVIYLKGGYLVRV
eukprot:snap_masked-scaffold_21-processed-gene-5.38-mRNA-1 protein AED:1.00 eAED:1.00 QI:0/0/0/0/1/1/2/0/127